MIFRRSPRPYLSLATLTGLTVCSAVASAEIDYHVKVVPDPRRIEVTVTIPAKVGNVDLQMPSWAPGAYAYGDFYENVRDVAATGPDGALAVSHRDKNTWRVAVVKNGPIKVSYWVTAAGRNRFLGGSTDKSYVQISGPQNYMYVVGRKTEACKIDFEVPKGWPLVTGLDAAAGGPNFYKAPTYDVLADNPVSTGDLIIEKYNLRGKDHYVVLEGEAKKQVDLPRLVKDCRFVSAAETDFWGGAPYHKYVWHFTVFSAPDGAGGLEHLSSTQIQLSSGEGPRAQSVLAHEYFHLWNVKRIRAFPLGPFNYLTLPRTGALWWLEGVTDYYATLLPYRYGEWKRPALLAAIVSNYQSVRNNAAYKEVGANESSLKVADAEEGRGNSDGYRISYYNLGWLAGLCLDTEIRAQTHNRRSLDDVIHALYAECKDNKPGFQEDEIRKLCVKFGGDSLGPYYDQVVMKAGEMPLQAQLAKMALKLDEVEETFVDTGFTAAPARGGVRGLRVAGVHGPAEGKLQRGDTITAVNGNSLDTEDMSAFMKIVGDVRDKAAVGTPIHLTVKRGDETRQVTIDPVSSTRKVVKVEEDPAASKDAVALREGWLFTKKPSVE